MTDALRAVRHAAFLAPLLWLGACQTPNVQLDTAPMPGTSGERVERADRAFRDLVPQGHDWPKQDPALLRRELLRRFDARIRAVATDLHLQARLVLDEVIPIPYLGIDVDPAPGGMKVTAVYGGTGAAEAGLRQGDLLVAIGDTPMKERKDLANAIRANAAGAVLTLHTQRDGKPQTLQATLGNRPEEDEDEEEQFPDLPRLAGPSAAPYREDFAHGELGGECGSLDTVLGGHGQRPEWHIREAGNLRFLRQESTDRSGIHFPMALARDFDARDVVGRVKLRYSGGEVDKAGGIVLRYLDAGNYLVARVNAAEGDLRIFRCVNGVRHTLPGAIGKGATDDTEWHTLEFRAEGTQLTATLDGKVTVTACDSLFARGRCGLWTKSDSITDFDDLVFEPIAPK